MQTHVSPPHAGMLTCIMNITLRFAFHTLKLGKGTENRAVRTTVCVCNSVSPQRVSVPHVLGTLVIPPHLRASAHPPLSRRSSEQTTLVLSDPKKMHF